MFQALDDLFMPKNVALVGATDQFGSMGRSVLGHLLSLPCPPKMVVVNPSHDRVGGKKCYASLDDATLDQVVDTVIITLSVDRLLPTLREMNRCAVHWAVYVCEQDPLLPFVRDKLLKAKEYALKHRIQLLVVPPRGLNGVYPTHSPVSACAYVGHSPDVADCVDSFAQEHGIEFSRFVVVYPQVAPISTGCLIDHLARQTDTQALLVQITQVDDVQGLVSALTAFSRNRTVVVLLTLPDEEQERILVHALKRNRILWVPTLAHFLMAIKLIHSGRVGCGRRMMVVSNTPQIGALTLKILPEMPIDLALLSRQSIQTINQLLPYRVHHHNPLYLPTEVSPALIQAVVEQVLQDDNADALLLIYAGNNADDGQVLARMMGALQKHSRKPLLLSWVGTVDSPTVRTICQQNKVLYFAQPEQALHALEQLNVYRDHSRRYAVSGWHDYRLTVKAVEDLKKYLIPLLPMAVPAIALQNKKILEALGASNQTQGKRPYEAHLIWQWEHQDLFGQTLTLVNDLQHTVLLPPLTPEVVHQALQQLHLPSEQWSNWLLNAGEIHARLPEIHSSRLVLSWDAQKGVICHEIKTTLQDPDSHHKVNVYQAYPLLLEKTLMLQRGQTLYQRPIRSEDAELIQELFANQSEASRYNRFLTKIENLPLALLARLSRLDYQRECGLMVCDEHNHAVAIASYTADSNGLSCEFGISIADAWQGQGVGVIVLQNLIEHARKQGFQIMRADILIDNIAMQKLAQKMGFTLRHRLDDRNLLEAELIL